MDQKAQNSMLEEAAAALAMWRERVQKIQSGIAEAVSIVASSEQRRREHALEAALGSHDSKKHLAQVLEDDRRATRELEDLRLALPLAESELKSAENAHRIAEAEVRKADVNRIALLRIDAARDVDRALADCSSALQRYQELGHDLRAILDDPLNMNVGEQIDGWNRIARSLPAPFVTLQKRLPGVFFGGGAPLAQSEAAHWGVTALRKDAA